MFVFQLQHHWLHQKSLVSLFLISKDLQFGIPKAPRNQRSRVTSFSRISLRQLAKLPSASLQSHAVLYVFLQHTAYYIRKRKNFLHKALQLPKQTVPRIRQRTIGTADSAAESALRLLYECAQHRISFNSRYTPSERPPLPCRRQSVCSGSSQHVHCRPVLKGY